VNGLNLNGLEDAARPFPRPQMRRSAWSSLDGEWDFAIDAPGEWQAPDDVTWDKKIVVPFSPETKASGIHETGFYSVVWYRRMCEAKHPGPGQRLLLHFEAVDHSTIVWVNGKRVGSHKGGYTPFHFDITDVLQADGQQEIIVRAEDDPADLAKPRGKQDWQLQPHSIWYPRTTGIWQTVWTEVVPETRIECVRWTPNLERWEIGFEAWVSQAADASLRMRVHLRVDDVVLADDTVTVIAGEVHRRIALSDPGIDDYRNELLWCPERPTLITAEIELWRERQCRLDAVSSYTALRAVAVQRDRFLLNGRPYYMRLVLDQGYWPQTGMTAPDDQALRRDVELAKEIGRASCRERV